MGVITLEKSNHLFWLGRYAERVTGNARNFFACYDRMIDVDEYAYIEFCDRLSIPSDIYSGPQDFVERFVYDEANPDSLYTALLRAYNNAVVLRDEISSETLSYIELAKAVFEKETRGILMLDLQVVMDYLNAFWGSSEDTIEDAPLRIMKCGKHAEKLDILYRFDKDSDKAIEDRDREMRHLISRIDQLDRRYEIRGIEETRKLFDQVMVDRQDLIDRIYALSNCFEDID